MKFSSDKVTAAFLAASHVKDALTIPSSATGPLVSIDQLKSEVAKRSHSKIKIVEVEVEAPHIRGYIERWVDNKATVFLRRDQPLEWKRFVAAKEMMHLIVDKPADFSPKAADTLIELVLEENFEWILGVDPAKAPAQSEMIAHFAAVEVLYPLDQRQKDVAGLVSGAVTIAQLAQKCGIPSNYASLALNLKYLNFLGEALAEVTKKMANNGKS